MAYIVITAMLLWVAASAVSVCPSARRQTRALAGAAAVFTAISAAAGILSMGEMFCDVTEAVVNSWITAAVCVAGIAMSAGAFAVWAKQRKKDTYSTENRKVNEQSRQKKR